MSFTFYVLCLKNLPLFINFGLFLELSVSAIQEMDKRTVRVKSVIQSSIDRRDALTSSRVSRIKTNKIGFNVSGRTQFSTLVGRPAGYPTASRCQRERVSEQRFNVPLDTL